MSSDAGRPEVIIDWQMVNKLLGIQCTMKEICSILGVSHDTLLRRCKEKFNMDFASYSEEKGSAGRISLRRKQFDVAMGGNVAMLIFLGKQVLGQSEKSEVGLRDLSKLTDEEIDKRLEELKTKELEAK